MADNISDYDLIVEVCHDLINRALRIEVENAEQLESWAGYSEGLRTKEAAIRRMLADNEKLRNGLKKIAEYPVPAYSSAQECFRAIESGVDTAYRTCAEIAKKALE